MSDNPIHPDDSILPADDIYQVDIDVLQDVTSPAEQELAQKLGIDVSEILQAKAIIETLVPEARDVSIVGGNNRFYYAFAEIEGRPAFVKLAKETKYNPHLMREYAGQCIARSLGWPCLNLLVEYRDSSQNDPLGMDTGGGGLIGIERADIESGELFTSPQLLVSADPSYGRAAARALACSGQSPISDDIDTSLLRQGDDADWRSKSADTFWVVWEEGVGKVLDPLFDDFRNGLIPQVVLDALLEEVRASLEPLISAANQEGTRYLVHNDAGYNNLFFQAEEGADPTALLLDFEFAGATTNRILARMTDWGNCFARCWSNPAMQKEFISGLLDVNPDEDLAEKYEIVRGVIVFGSMYLAKYAMAADHHEHQMSQMLLENLQENLTHLDKEYEKRKQVSLGTNLLSQSCRSRTT